MLTKQLSIKWRSSLYWMGLAALSLNLTGCEQLLEYIPPVTSFLPIPQTAAKPSAANQPQSADLFEMENFVASEINSIRQKEGLNTLKPNSKLAAIARNYSRRMANEKFFAHVSPKGDRPSDRVSSAGVLYWVVGENLFTSTNIPQPAPAAVQGWMDSPGHRENILRPSFTETGIGVWKQGNTYYFTQLFIRPL